MSEAGRFRIRCSALVATLLALVFLGFSTPANAAGSESGYYAWGRNDTAQLGDGSGNNALSPENIAGVDLRLLSTGQFHTCGLDASGAAFCWGRNDYGQLGMGSATGTRALTPVTMPSGVTFTSIATLIFSTCALASDGSAYCWGLNEYGELGVGDLLTRTSPQLVAMPVGVTFTQIVGGFQHACGLTAAGAAYCWGYNGYGQLGLGAVSNQTTPQPVIMPVGVTFTSLQAGSMHMCGLTAGGAAYCWGDNRVGQLGIGNVTIQNTPQPVSMPVGVTFDRLLSGGNHVCGSVTGVGLYCWGYNLWGQLGLGNTVDQTTAQAVPDSQELSYTAGFAGLRHTCMLTRAGAAYCWGSNQYGQLGVGDLVSRSTPQAVSGSLAFSVLAPGPVSFSTFGLPLREASGDQVPQAPMQQFGRGEKDSCDHQPTNLIDFPALADKVDMNWGSSWAEWPNSGTGGFVCTRQPFYTSTGTWAVR